MKRLLSALVFCSLSCSAPSAMHSADAQLEGQISSAVPATLRGDAYVLLFDAEEGIGLDSQPRRVTAIPDARLASGDARYLFADVKPGRFLLSAIVDVNQNADLNVDVLAQPGAGDLVSQTQEISLVEGETRLLDVAMQRRVVRDPPAFKAAPETPARVVIPDQLGSIVSFRIEASGLGLLSSDGFHVRFVDANNDGQPDDANADSIPEFEPQVFLRFRAKPGQTVPINDAGRAADVILPLAFNPAGFLTELAGDVKREVVVPELTLFVLPQAQAVWTEGTTRTVQTLSAIPVGDYELVVLDAVSGYWRVPNALSERGGELASQGTQFRVEHGTGIDAGTFMPPMLPGGPEVP